MSTTAPKMLERKGANDILADVDESKKAKSDPPTKDKHTNPTIRPDPPNQESRESETFMFQFIQNLLCTVETIEAETKFTNLTIGPDAPFEESMEINSTNPAVELLEDETFDPVDDSQYMQVIITGPPRCGKSCLVLSYMEQFFPPKHGEFLSKQYLHILQVNKQAVMICDLDARKALTEYRYQSYKEADIALLCFSVKIPKDSQKRCLENLLYPWMNELDCHCGKIPIILVGLKGDLRRKYNENCFSEDDIKKVLKRYSRIVLYKEVSAFLDKVSVKELFATSIACIDEPKAKKMYTNPDSDMDLGDR